MSISEAIALVRRGAKKASLDGALNALAGRLKSDGIPSPLRPLAARLAALLGVPQQSPLYKDAARQQLEIVTFDRELVRTSASNLQAGSAQPARSETLAHGAGDVCPFTGLRADGSVGTEVAREVAPEAPAPAVTEPRAPEPQAEEFAEVHTGELQAVEIAAALEEAAADARGSAREQKQDAPASAVEPVGNPTSKRSGGQKRAGGKADGEKRKEKVAVANDVTNTSARSATRSAAKQSSGRGQTSGRKKA